MKHKNLFPLFICVIIFHWVEVTDTDLQILKIVTISKNSSPLKEMIYLT